jgi:hypothetical protein
MKRGITKIILLCSFIQVMGYVFANVLALLFSKNISFIEGILMVLLLPDNNWS